MKQLRQLCAATVLSLTFALSAFAGDMQFPGITLHQPSNADSSVLTTTTMIILTIIEAIPLP